MNYQQERAHNKNGGGGRNIPSISYFPKKT